MRFGRNTDGMRTLWDLHLLVLKVERETWEILVTQQRPLKLCLHYRCETPAKSLSRKLYRLGEREIYQSGDKYRGHTSLKVSWKVFNKTLCHQTLKTNVAYAYRHDALINRRLALYYLGTLVLTFVKTFKVQVARWSDRSHVVGWCLIAQPSSALSED